MQLGEKDPDVDTEYAIDARAAIVTDIRREWPYSVGLIGKAPRHTGWYYECSTAGETSAHWPMFTRAAGETFTDGSVVWTARHPDDANLPGVSSVTWTVSGVDDSLEVSSERIVGGIVLPTLTGGTDGVDYEVTAHIVWSSAKEDDVTVTIPVRSQ